MPKLKPSKRRGHQAIVADLQGQVERLQGELAAANRCAARLEKWVQKQEHRPECLASTRQRPNGDVIMAGGRCSCGLTAALSAPHPAAEVPA